MQRRRLRPPVPSPAVVTRDRRRPTVLSIMQLERGGTRIMVADTGGAGRSARWAAARRQPGWIGLLGNAARILTTIGLGVAALYGAQVVSGANAAAAAITI